MNYQYCICINETAINIKYQFNKKAFLFHIIIYSKELKVDTSYMFSFLFLKNLVYVIN